MVKMKLKSVLTIPIPGSGLKIESGDPTLIVASQGSDAVSLEAVKVGSTSLTIRVGNDVVAAVPVAVVS